MRRKRAKVGRNSENRETNCERLIGIGSGSVRREDADRRNQRANKDKGRIHRTIKAYKHKEQRKMAPKGNHQQQGSVQPENTKLAKQIANQG